MENMLSLKNRVAIVTGAGSGIGRITAKLLASQGASVTIISRSEQELQSLQREITQYDRKSVIIVGDVSNPQKMKEACTKTVDAFGKIDIVIANAGVNGVWAPVEALSPDDFLKTVQINLYGTFNIIHYAVPYLKRQGGSIVVTSSINGNRKFTSAGSVAYSSSKAAQVALTKVLAVELGPYKIRVNAVCPGSIATQIQDNTKLEETEHIIKQVEFPEGKIPLTKNEPGSSEQVADLILFLCSEAASHINGTEVYIDGGQSLL